MRLPLIFCVVLLIKSSFELPTGAPLSACEDMTPDHGGNQPQTGNAPIEIITPEWIVSNHVITVIIRRTNVNFVIRGFKIQARLQATGELIGTFQSSNDVSLVNCNEIFGSAATHTINNQKAEVHIQWEVPDVADLTLFNFVVTVVETFDRFWVNERSGLLAVVPEWMGPTTTTIPTTPGLPGDTTPADTTTIPIETIPPPTDDITSPTTPVDDSELDAIFSGCGDTKTCFGIPEFCYQHGDCDSFTSVTYNYPNATFSFELLSSANQNYIAMGISHTRSMADSSVIECVRSNPTVIDAFTSLTFGRTGADRGVVNQLIISMTEYSIINGRIYCNVDRPARSDINGILFDLETTRVYLLLASGTEFTAEYIIRHNFNRDVSRYNTLLTVPESIGGDGSTSALMLIHGSFMIVAWIGLTSMGIVMARYFKPAWQNRKACGKDVWFMWHVLCMFLTWALTLAGFIIIFVDLGEWITSVHSVLGCIVFSLSSIQAVGAVFRPDPKAIDRPLFNWLHRAFGNITHLLAIITIFYAVGLPRAALPHYTLYVLVAFASFYLFMHIIFTTVDICGTMKQKKRLGVSTSKDTPYKLLQKTLLGLFAIVILLFVIALLLIYNLDFSE